MSRTDSVGSVHQDFFETLQESRGDRDFFRLKIAGSVDDGVLRSDGRNRTNIHVWPEKDVLSLADFLVLGGVSRSIAIFDWTLGSHDDCEQIATFAFYYFQERLKLPSFERLKRIAICTRQFFSVYQYNTGRFH